MLASVIGRWFLVRVWGILKLSISLEMEQAFVVENKTELTVTQAQCFSDGGKNDLAALLARRGGQDLKLQPLHA